MNIARIGNKYLQETEPWKLAKTEPERVATILNVSLQICASLAVAFEPFLPFMSEKLVKMLGLGKLEWSQIGQSDLIKAGATIAKPELLFEKIEEDAIQAQLDRLARIKEENKVNSFKPAPQQPDVEFDDFMKADIRVGTVTECIKVPKADKLLKLTIDDGTGNPRTIVSGIAAYYQPEKLVGMQVCFIANLPVRKLRGIESQGMVLSAVNADGSLTIIGPTAQATNGAQVK
jgi:methionyl-tRNA synthetase